MLWKRNSNTHGIDSYPGIDRVFQLFAGRSPILTRAEFSQVLDDAMLLTADPEFHGVRWMTEMSEAMWRGSGDPGWVELYQPLTSLLYGIGFIGCSIERTEDAIYAAADPSFADVGSNLAGANYFHVHPTFHRALDLP